MILIFDLDDTLYEEYSFVKSGFHVVSDYLGLKYDLNSSDIFFSFIENLKKSGRGKVFDNTLSEFGIYSKKEVQKCISVYRLHKPNISLNQETKDFLISLNAFNKYLVTDGNKIVQYNKIKALKLGKFFNKIFITHRYGIKHAKPSPYCFNLIKKIEKDVPYSEMVYIGDNENKDFVGIKPLGIKTIRVRQGMFKDIDLPMNFKADIELFSIQEITIDLLNELVNN